MDPDGRSARQRPILFARGPGDLRRDKARGREKGATQLGGPGKAQGRPWGRKGAHPAQATRAVSLAANLML